MARDQPTSAAASAAVRPFARAWAAMSSFSAIWAGSVLGRPKRTPLCRAAVMPALTRSMMSSRSYSARVASMFSNSRPVGVAGSMPSALDATGLFIAIGHDPRSKLVEGQIELDDDGYVKIAHPSTRTNLDGVCACGDLVDKRYRQAITAAGTGCAAALDAEHYLAEHGLADPVEEQPAIILETP